MAAIRLDAHQHFWTYNEADYAWIDQTSHPSILKQDYLPDYLLPSLRDNGLHGCIAVQARQTEEETEYLLALKEHPDEWDKLRANPSLINSLVPEIIRWQTPLTSMRRTTTRPVVINDQ